MLWVSTKMRHALARERYRQTEIPRVAARWSHAVMGEFEGEQAKEDNSSGKMQAESLVQKNRQECCLTF